MPQSCRDGIACRGVVDPPVAGQLVGLLSVLAAALAVALAGEAAVAVEGPADAAHREREVDERQDVADALRLLLGAARREHQRIRARPRTRAAVTMSRCGTPVRRSTRSGQKVAACARTASNPSVRSRM